MTRDKYLRLVFIPLLGVVIPFFSGIITYNRYSPLELIAVISYFILLSYCIWTGASWIHGKVRSVFGNYRNPIFKVSVVSVVGGVYGAVISGIFSLAWYKISKENFSWTPVFRCIAYSSLAVLLFTLLYEILFLSTQRNLYTKMMGQLDFERSKAEMSVLKNELEPHFIFNSLNTLSYLILNDPATAHEFNSKLASVYKYFLINKDRELITLQGEIEFIENYFFVLQVRHDNKLHLSTELSNTHEAALMILPYALQILVENAIKHNEFSDEDPLHIKVSLNGEYIYVRNNKKPRPYLVNSTGIGLRNLSARYKLVCNKDIQIENNENEFLVKLPLIKLSTHA
ncbi:MAG TPA: histidine kinase [Chitinophagaceae bacterium]|nr:histidine kinase [Chitinophagaceae bacterium]